MLILDLTGKVVAASGLVGWCFDLTWSHDGRAVLFAAATTGKIQSLDTNGRVRELYSAPGEIWLYDIAVDGSFVLDLATGDLSTLVYRDGDAEMDLPWMGRSSVLDITPAGDTVLFTDRVAESSAAGVYLRRLDGSAPMLLGRFAALALAPDASAVLAMSDKEPQTMLLVPAGTGKPRALGSWTAVSGGVILPDGKSAIVLGAPRGFAGGLWRIALDKGAITPVTARALAKAGPASPDSKMIAVTTIDQVPHVLAFDNPAALRDIRDATRHESITGWSNDSRFVYLATPGYPYELYRVELATGARSFVRRLIPRTPGVMDATNPLVANDGKTTVCGATRVVNSNLWIAGGIR